jgi:hypothetical protein
MAPSKRATVYFGAQIFRALCARSAETGTSVSHLVNAAVRHSLAEDADDLAAFRERAKEPRLTFEAALRGGNRREVYRR